MPSPCKRVDQAGGVADEEDAPACRDGADHAHLQPAAEAPALDGGGQEAESAEVIAEGVEAVDRPRRGGSVALAGRAQADVGGARLAREQPAVAGEPVPGRLVPQRDDRAVDVLAT